MAKTSTQKLATDWLICHLRWLWLIIAFVISQLTVQPGDNDNLTTIYMLLGIGVLYNVVILILLSTNWYPDWMGVIAAGFDTILAIGLMWFSGGFNSAQMPVFLFVVIATALRVNAEMGLLVATPIVLTYAVSVILLGDTAVDNLIDISIKAITLFTAAGVAGYIGRKQLQSVSGEDKEEIKRLQAANERAKAIYEMANTLSSTLDYRKVLKAMVDLAYIALSEVDNRKNGIGAGHNGGTVGMVLLFEGDGPLGKLKLAVGRNIPRMDEDKTVTTEDTVLAQIIYKAEATTVSDLQSDPALRQFIALQRCNSMVCAPLRAGFDTYGLVLFATPQVNFYTSEHASLLATFCNQAIIALQNAQLYADLEMEQKKLLEKEAQARAELARNLHDGPTQAISAVAMRINFVRMILKREGDVAKSLEELEKIEEIAKQTTQEIRNMLFTLRPVVLETQGLVAAIHQYADRLRDLDKLNIEVNIHGYDGQLSTEAEGVIFTIIEEAVGNAKKHADAELIQIILGVHNNRVIAQISDNGSGFDVAATKSTYHERTSLGLLNLEERAQMIGGRCNLISAVGQGTTVKVEAPLDKLATAR